MTTLREHQREAVDAAVAQPSAVGRTQVVMARGTGKTLVGRGVADRLVGPDGMVGVLVSTLSLLAQSLRAWRTASRGDGASGTGSVLCRREERACAGPRIAASVPLPA